MYKIRSFARTCESTRSGSTPRAAPWHQSCSNTYTRAGDCGLYCLDSNGGGRYRGDDSSWKHATGSPLDCANGCRRNVGVTDEYLERQTRGGGDPKLRQYIHDMKYISERRKREHMREGARARAKYVACWISIPRTLQI